MLGLLKRECYEKKNTLLAMMLGELLMVSLPVIMMLTEKNSQDLGMLLLLFYPMAYLLLDFLQTSLVEDERKVAAYFWCSTPKGRDGVVGAKYLIVLFTSVVLTGYIIVLDLIRMAMGNENTGAYKIALLLMFLQLFLRSLEMPFIFTLGSKYGNYAKMFSISVVCIVVLGYMLFGPLPEGFSADFIWDALRNIFFGGDLSDKIKLLMGVLASAVCLLYYISYRISCKGYWHGVEEYEA